MVKTIWSIEECEHGFVMEIVNDKDERERVEIEWETAKWLKERLQSGLKRHLKETKVLKLGGQMRTIDIERR